MKDLCARHNVPTAAYEKFTDVEKAKAYIRAQGAPIVVKARVHALHRARGWLACGQLAAEAAVTGDWRLWRLRRRRRK